MRISVLMAVKDGMPFLPAAVLSILNQTERNFEFLIFDDGSEDGTSAYLESLTDERVLIMNGSCRGLAQALNELLTIAKGEYIVRMDADDISDRDRFKKQIQFLDKNKDVHVLGTAAVVIDEADRMTGSIVKPNLHEDIVSALPIFTPLIHPSVMIRQQSLVDVGGYDGRLQRVQDKELWIRMAKRGLRFANLAEPLIRYRIISGKQSHGLARKRLKAQLYIAKKHSSVKLLAAAVYQYVQTWLG